MKNPTVVEMVSAYLREHGYDGLWGDAGCACELGDLAPCDEPWSECQAGYKATCPCGDYDFRIVADKPEVIDG
jgi:hypothetical protein